MSSHVWVDDKFKFDSFQCTMWCSREHLFNIPSYRVFFFRLNLLGSRDDVAWTHSCALPENIHTPPTEGNGTPREWRLCKTKKVKEIYMYEAWLEFPKFPSVEGYEYFLELHNVAWARFWPSAVCGLSLLLVPAFLWGFFSRFSGFPPSTKINNAKFQFD